MTTTRIVERVAWEALYGWLSAHAACGYPTELPAPEVLERPGWRVVVADGFASSYHIHVQVPPLPPEAWKKNAIPPHDVETEVVYPTGVSITLDRELTRAPWTIASIGFDVGQRIIVLFPRLP